MTQCQVHISGIQNRSSHLKKSTISPMIQTGVAPLNSDNFYLKLFFNENFSIFFKWLPVWRKRQNHKIVILLLHENCYLVFNLLFELFETNFVTVTILSVKSIKDLQICTFHINYAGCWLLGFTRPLCKNCSLCICFIINLRETLIGFEKICKRSL